MWPGALKCPSNIVNAVFWNIRLCLKSTGAGSS